MDDGLLITLVQTNECLYNKERSDYKDAIKKENVWMSIAEACACSVAEAKARFKSLREKFVREKYALQGRSGGGQIANSKWHLYYAMLWLIPHLSTRKNSTTNYNSPTQSTKGNCTPADSDVLFFELTDNWEECSTSTSSNSFSSSSQASNPLPIPPSSWTSFAPLSSTHYSSSSSSSPAAASASSYNPSPPAPPIVTAPTLVPSAPATQYMSHKGGVKRKEQSNKEEQADKKFHETLSSIANRVMNKPVPTPNKEHDFGQMVATELSRCTDANAVKAVKGKIAALLFELP